MGGEKPMKYSALSRNQLFSSALSDIKVQSIAKLPSSWVLTNKWESGYNPKLSRECPMPYGCTLDSFLELTTKGALQVGGTVAHGSFYTTAKITQKALEVGLKDSKRGPLMVGGSATKNFAGGSDSGNVQAAYTAFLANGVQLGFGAKLKFDGSVAKTEATLAGIGNLLQASATYELEKSVCTMHSILEGPQVCGMKTAFGGLVATTKETVTNVGLAAQLRQNTLKFLAKCEKLNTASPVPSITLSFEDCEDKVDMSFSVEHKDSKPCFGFSMSL